MNVTEANAVNVLARALGIIDSDPAPDRGDVFDALTTLASAAHHRLGAGVTLQQVDAWEAGAIIPTPALFLALYGARSMDPECWFDQATAFSCREADALAALLTELDRGDTAQEFLQLHREGDEAGDDHLEVVAP